MAVSLTFNKILSSAVMLGMRMVAPFLASIPPRLDLSRLTNVLLSASGNFGIAAYDGGRIDLSRLQLAEIGPGLVDVQGAGSRVDLSAFGGLWRGLGSGALKVGDGGTLLTPNLTAIHGLSVEVNDNAIVSLSQLKSFASGFMRFYNRTNDLAGLTNFTGSIVAVNSRLDLTNFTVLYVTNHVLIQSDQNSVIDLSRVTNAVTDGSTLSLHASGGGVVDLRRMRNLITTLNIDARDGGTLINLSGLNGVREGGSLDAVNGATVLIPNVTALHNIHLTVSDGSTVPTAQLHSLSGMITLLTQTNLFTALTNFSGSFHTDHARAEFPSLTQIETEAVVSFRADNGSSIDLSHLTNVISDLGVFWLAAFTGGRIEAPHLETIHGGSVDIGADGPGSTINLSGLNSFVSHSDLGTLQTAGNGSVILSPNALLLAGINVNFEFNAGVLEPSFASASEELVLYAEPWRSYKIETRDPAVAGSPWKLFQRVPLIETLQVIGPRPQSHLDLRVYEFEAEPAEVDIRRAGLGFTETILYGVSTRNYQIETKTNLSTGTWQNGPTRTLTNSFFIFPSTAATNQTRFYRARPL